MQRWVCILWVLCCSISMTAFGYSCGSGDPNDPYQIATAQDLIDLGNDPNDYDKHFILTADIDLDPNLPGGRFFARAVIAPDVNDDESGFQGPEFTGRFDGRGHVIRHLRITGQGNLGLFGSTGLLAHIENLGLVDAEVNGVGIAGGLLAGKNSGSISTSYSMGTIRGNYDVGGLVGYNEGSISTSYSMGTIRGNNTVGGLVGINYGTINTSYSTGSVIGADRAGGLAAENGSYGYTSMIGTISVCYSTGTVSGDSIVGGLVGKNGSYYSKISTITNCYSTGIVSGDIIVGGLVGSGYDKVSASFWDIQTSGQSESGGGEGLLTARMLDIHTYLNAGWDFVNDIWFIPMGNTPGLTWSRDRYFALPHVVGMTIEQARQTLAELGIPFRLEYQINNTWPEDTVVVQSQEPGDQLLAGQAITLWLGTHVAGAGTAADPYQIATARQLLAMGSSSMLYDQHFVLTADIDLSGYTFDRAVIAPDLFDAAYSFQGDAFSGSFDGQGHVISYMRIRGKSCLGLFGATTTQAVVESVDLEHVDVNGVGHLVGSLVGRNYGTVRACYSMGKVSGKNEVGGLVGSNLYGSITSSFSTGTVSGHGFVGGLAGTNRGLPGCIESSIGHSHSTASVHGEHDVGALVGNNGGFITASYGAGTVRGDDYVGGLVGGNEGLISTCYSTATVSGGWERPFLSSWFQFVSCSGGYFYSNTCYDMHTEDDYVGGLVGANGGSISTSYSMGTVSGGSQVGGLVGANGGPISTSYSTGTVSGGSQVLVMVGVDGSPLSTGYSLDSAGREDRVGGLVGYNEGSIQRSYSTGTVSGEEPIGGLVGDQWEGTTIASFWDTQSSGQSESAGGEGLLTTRMLDIQTYLYAGWDFVSEIANGSDDVWYMPMGKTPGLTGPEDRYSVFPDVVGMTVEQAQKTLAECGILPVELDYQINNTLPENRVVSQNREPGDQRMEGKGIILVVYVNIEGMGTSADPYQIATPRQLITMGSSPPFYDKQYALTASIDLGAWVFQEALIAPHRGEDDDVRTNPFSGRFDGQGYSLSNLTIEGDSNLGLFGTLHADAVLTNLRLENVQVHGLGDHVGALAAVNLGAIMHCHSEGHIEGNEKIGGLVGTNGDTGNIASCSTVGHIVGRCYVNGIAGQNQGVLSDCTSTTAVEGKSGTCVSGRSR